jgi:hypothetical protein|tara:strand:+ start:65 stop:316 length:252 start_codon:yes stop_codon:yes gene_type:complete
MKTTPYGWALAAAEYYRSASSKELYSLNNKKDIEEVNKQRFDQLFYDYKAEKLTLDKLIYNHIKSKIEYEQHHKLGKYIDILT